MRAARCLGLALALLCLCRPAAPWYRQAAGPRLYSVGRASGLLSGLRRSPYIRRSDAAESRPGALPPGSARSPVLPRTAVSTGAAGGSGHRGHRGCSPWGAGHGVCWGCPAAGTRTPCSSEQQEQDLSCPQGSRALGQPSAPCSTTSWGPRSC